MGPDSGRRGAAGTGQLGAGLRRLRRPRRSGRTHSRQRARARARVASRPRFWKPGQIVEVKVIKVEPGDGGSRARIGLSMRAFAPDPWMSARAQFPVGATVPGDRAPPGELRGVRRDRARPRRPGARLQADARAPYRPSAADHCGRRSRAGHGHGGRRGAAPHQPVDGRTGPPRARRAGRRERGTKSRRRSAR